ncbi:MAG: hypothetical protein IPM69_05085 [Ignavibacteria bacterium]|nr:hypothetical protein [Ignavibacteria bacterium]
MATRQILVILVIVVFATGALFSQVPTLIPDSSKLVTISSRVGSVIDSIDIKYYRLLYHIKHINSATAYKIDSVRAVFVLKRYALPDTMISTSVENIEKYLPYFIENIEYISDKSVYSTIPPGQLDQLLFQEDYESRFCRNRDIRIVKRDNSEIQGKILLITNTYVIISNRTGNYNWKDVHADLQYVYYNEIDRIVGSEYRFYRGNEPLILDYLSKEYSTSLSTSFFNINDGKPIPSEVRRLLIHPTPSQNSYSGFASLDSLRLLKPRKSDLTIGVGIGGSFPEYVTQHNFDWNNQGYGSHDSYANSLYFPFEIMIGYKFLKDRSEDKWSISGNVALITNSDMLISKNIWLCERVGVQFQYVFNPLEHQFNIGSDIAFSLGVDVVAATFSGDFERIQGNSEVPLDGIIYPKTLNMTTLLTNAGIWYRYHLSDNISINFHAISNFTINQFTHEQIKQTWGKHGRNFYKTMQLLSPDFSMKLGAVLSYTF